MVRLRKILVHHREFYPWDKLSEEVQEAHKNLVDELGKGVPEKYVHTTATNEDIHALKSLQISFL
jgi:hypothetical protein